MLQRVLSGYGRVRGGRKNETVAGGRAGKARGIEALERRFLLSVSAQALAGPLERAGNTWTYEIVGAGTLTYTVKGLTTLNGHPAIERDLVTAENGAQQATGQDYYAFTSQGLVYYQQGLTATEGGSSSTSAYSPFRQVFPASVDGSVQFSNPTWTDTTTAVSGGGSPVVSTSSNSSAGTLVSEMPNVPIHTPAGDFMCWEVDGTETDTPISPADSPTTDVTKSYIAPNVGLVEEVDETTGQTTRLTSYSVVSTHLEVLQQPSNTLAGDTISPAVQVAIRDSTGATDTKPEDAVTVTASIGVGGTGTGTLKGGDAVTTVNGVATFGGLSIDKPGSYVLNFSDSAGRSVSSALFQVSAGKLVFKKPIKDALSGSALEPAVEVDLVDAKGKLITDAPSLVTLTPAGLNVVNPISGNTAQLVNGRAVFNSVKLIKPGVYTLNATDAQGDAGGVSNQFDVTGVHLAFRKQPGKVGANSPLKYTLVLEDSRNRLVNNSSLGLGMTLNTVEGGAGAALAHPADVFFFGVANNSAGDRASVNAPGKYTITFTVINNASFDYSIDPITSDPFEVVGNQLAFIRSPGKALPNVRLNYKVAMLDYKHHLVNTASDTLTFTLNPVGGAAGVLSGGQDSLVAGIADNESTIPLTINLAGSYTLTVVDVPAGGEPAALSATSKVFKVISGKPK